MERTDPTDREHRLAAAFIRLTDTLVKGFDLVGLFDDLANACVELLDVTAAGLMLADANGTLRVMASSSERSRLLELLEIQNDEGPCLDCCRDGRSVVVADLASEGGRWPRFTAEAIAVGYGAAYALPMRLRENTIGALNLFHHKPNTLSTDTLRLAQAFADAATIGILQQRAIERSTELAVELQAAFNSRLVIEQAKGALAERAQIDVAAAFELIRRYARRTNQKLSDVAARIIAGEMDTGELAAADSARPNPSPDSSTDSQLS